MVSNHITLESEQTCDYGGSELRLFRTLQLLSNVATCEVGHKHEDQMSERFEIKVTYRVA